MRSFLQSRIFFNSAQSKTPARNWNGETIFLALALNLVFQSLVEVDAENLPKTKMSTTISFGCDNAYPTGRAEVHCRMLGNQRWPLLYRRLLNESLNALRSTEISKQSLTEILEKSVVGFTQLAAEEKREKRNVEAALGLCAGANCLYYLGHRKESVLMSREALGLLRELPKEGKLLLTIANNRDIAVVDRRLLKEGSEELECSVAVQFVRSGLCNSGVSWIFPNEEEVEHTPCLGRIAK